MATVVYVLCLLTALGCTGGLLRAWTRTRAPVLLLSAACFAGLALNEALVLVDIYVVPDVSLFPVRSATALVALSLMLAGLILHDRGRAA